ncbi:MAG: DUF2281 domain-containing protein [Candidatus Tectomicrobia bacterium]|uniref:DUF2281 domain-containing protein n=1 Tax=Tectimicrobiota bacterium TaxID=2528274 RepID=A0A933LQ57_UNCTE|nr:DUF2281 domain-containing protein [Candidatus Tectomicrobia bacterium]
MAIVRVNLKQQLMRELDELPPDKVEEVLDFVAFLKTRKVPFAPSLPASSLDSLTGLVAWGGDALSDSERLYDEST